LRDRVTRKGCGGNNPVTFHVQPDDMKIKSCVQVVIVGVKTSILVGAAIVFLSTGRPADAAPPAELLEKGIYTEETKGELQAAIQLYQQIVDDPQAQRGLVAQAQLRLGLCQLKLGNKPQAISAMDRLTREFPDKDALMSVVGQQMPQVLDEIVQQIEQHYILQVDRGELMDAAIHAISGKLDSRGGLFRTNDLEFLNAGELKEANVMIEQRIAGIGAVLKTNTMGVLVQMPLPGSPALEGGLRAGDCILSVNGVALPEEKTLESAVQLLRGPVGTTVTVGIQREGLARPQDVTLTRNIIKLPSVLGDRRKPDNTWDFMLDDSRKIGYIRLTQIGRQSADEMRAALDDLKARDMRALILDLREAPGGLLDGGIAIADLFVESGRIVTVKGRDGERAHDARAEGTWTGFPMALLVNRKTASAAEIVAACLQDHQRAAVVGERTFGQGIVRRLLQLKSGVGAVKLPVAAFYRPNGKAMNRFPGSTDSDDWGVTPHAGYEVVFSDDELKQYEKDRAARDGLYTGEAASPFRDRQLQKALEYIEAK
jgi:carboxyl-terminal processing protease